MAGLWLTPSVPSAAVAAAAPNGAAPHVVTPQDAAPQVAEPPKAAGWTVVVGGAAEPWPGSVVTPDRPGMLWRRELTRHMQERGYFFARIDSLDRALRTVWMHPGDAARIGRLSWSGMEGLGGEGLGEDGIGGEALGGDAFGGALAPDVQPADTLTQALLDHLVAASLRVLTERGFLNARVGIASIQPGPGGFDVHIEAEPGRATTIDGIQFQGDTRSNERFIRQMTGIEAGTPAAGMDLDALRRRAQQTPGVGRAGRPFFEVTSDSTARIVVPVEPLPPGQFDLVVGVLPATDNRSSTLVGGGHISLLNAFGAGRTMDMQLDRRPGQVSAARVLVSDPAVVNLPITARVGFDGLQQDSTFSNRTWSAGLGYRFDEQVSLGVRLAREVTRPGQGGLAEGIARSDATLWGVEITFRRIDNELQPHRGVTFTSLIERGDRRAATVSRMERLTGRVRGFVPVAERSTLVVGGDAALVRGENLDASQLVRFGGAQSLRGYDEDRFLVDTALRSVTEWRFAFETVSYAFAFVDVGYVAREETGLAEVFPGAGLGMVVETGAGLMNLSYAINKEDALTNGRIHVGLSFAL